jgi:hypothetical protein
MKNDRRNLPQGSGGRPDRDGGNGRRDDGRYPRSVSQIRFKRVSEMKTAVLP